MQIDASCYPRIGNMVSGGGLSAIFDNDAGSVGWAEDVKGWAGIDFRGNPQKVDKAVVWCASNGFDASGSATDVTLRLYAKNGTPPASIYDGTHLGSVGPFHDPNAATSHTIYSKNYWTQWDFLWVIVETGVWAILTQAKFYSPDVIQQCPNTERTIIDKSCDGGVLLNRQLTEIFGFRSIVQVDTPCVASINAKVEVIHRADFTRQDLPLSIGMYLNYRYSPTLDTLWNAPPQDLGRGAAGRNLMSLSHHYEALLPLDDLQLQSGFYQFGISGNANNYEATTDGLAGILVEGGKGLNNMRIVLDKNAVVFRN